MRTNLTIEDLDGFLEEPVVAVLATVRRDGSVLGAADAATPSRGGPAPDDWIDVDANTRRVTGSGFELRATDGGGDGLGAGRITADCN